MNKKIISLLLSFVLLLSVACPVAFADSDTATHTHTWVDTAVSFDMEVCGISVKINVKKCDGCGWYLHTANVVGLQFSYPSVHSLRALDGELIDALTSFVVRALGSNANLKQYETGGGSAGTGGVGRRPSGYLDDAGTPTYNADGNLILLMSHDSSCAVAHYDYLVWQCEHGTGTLSNSYKGFFDVTQTSCVIPFTLSSDRVSSSKDFLSLKVKFRATAPVSGYYTVPEQVIGKKSYAGYWSGNNVDIKVSKYRSSYTKGATIELEYSHAPSLNAYNDWDVLNFTRAPYLVCEPALTTINQQTNITINNNTWNGNIYQDNSTNLTYIYPQYTTINENNETVTNISENPIIYNNETKEYYPYDSVTNNYYYITYVTETPTPTPTDKPGGSISTPETGKPGGDTGSTSRILDVLVEIRDNMIQGFADLKATLVQGWADLSANFTLAIENLNVNIQNTFNKKFPDLPEPTPDPALPAPVEPSTGDKWSDDIVSGTSISGTVNAKAGDYVLATVSARSALTIPDSMTYLYKGNVFASNDVNQSMSFAYQKIAEDGTYTYTFKQATAGRMYLSLIVLSDIDGLSYSGKYHIEVKSKTPVSVPEKSDGDMLVWGCSSTAWLTSDTSNSKSWITNPDDLTYIGGASNSGQSRQANFIDLGTGAVSRTFFPYENSGDDLVFVVDAVEIIPKTITPSPSPSPSPTPDHGTDPTPAPTDKPSGGSTNNFWNFVFPGGNDDGTENGHKGILWALISLIIAVVTFVLGLGSAYSYVFPFLPAGLVTTIHICVLVLLLFAIIKFVRSFL